MEVVFESLVVLDPLYLPAQAFNKFRIGMYRVCILIVAHILYLIYPLHKDNRKLPGTESMAEQDGDLVGKSFESEERCGDKDANKDGLIRDHYRGRLGCLLELELMLDTVEEIRKGLDSVLCKAWKLDDFLQRVSILDEFRDTQVS